MENKTENKTKNSTQASVELIKKDIARTGNCNASIGNLLKDLKHKEIKSFIEEIKPFLNEEEFQLVLKSKQDYILYNPENGLMKGGKNWQRTEYTNQAREYYDTKNLYECHLFPFINASGAHYPIFRPGTINYIAARPGCGKTTAIITMVIDALVKGRKVVIYTCDESTISLHTKIIIAAAYNTFKKIEQRNPLPYDKRKMAEIIPALNGLKDFSLTDIAAQINLAGEKRFRKDDGSLLQSTAPDSGIPAEYKTYLRLQDTYRDFEESYLTNHQYTILNLPDIQEWDLFEDTLRGFDPGTLIFFDYIQAFDLVPEVVKNQEQLEKQKKLIASLQNLAKETKNIYICAAQLKRGEKETAITNIDSSDFAETSKIEQTAELAIGIGKVKYNGTEQTYYQIVKGRNTGTSETYWLKNDTYRYNTLEPMLTSTGDPTPTGTDKQYKEEVALRMGLIEVKTGKKKQSLGDWAAELETDNDPQDQDL